MSIERIKHSFKKIVEEVLDTVFDDEIFFETEVIELNINSILYIKMLVKLEMEFDVTFPEEIVLINKHVVFNDMVSFISDCNN